MNILITAGGTTEKIDEVRGITNTGTGRLGARIAEAFGAEPGVRHIFYLCSAKAVRPVCEKVSILVADDTEALAQAVKTLCGQERIDVVIHSMAVSDYRTGAVTSAAALTEQILAALAKTGDTASDRQRIQEALDKAPALSAEGKIGSGHEDLIVMLKPTPKIIGLFRGLCPDAILVGFKLLSGVPEPVLI